MSLYQHPPRVRALLRTMAPVACPPDVVELGLVDAVVDHVEEMMQATPRYLRAALLAGLTAYELGAVLWPPARGRTASRLDGARAAAYFRTWWRSRLGPRRELAKGIKGLLALAAYEQPALLHRIDYHPERWIAEVSKRRMETYGDEVRRGEAEVTRPDPLGQLVVLRSNRTSRKEAS
jgi:hypothetical protein